MADLTLIRWDDYSIPITLTNADWSAYDLTNCTVYFTIKDIDKIDLPDSESALLKKKITTHTDPTHWKTTLTLSNTDTNITIWEKRFDIQIKTAMWKIHSTMRWTVIIEDDVTKSLSI